MAHGIVIGKFGSGKSSFGTRLVIDELKLRERPIVTTLALNLAELNAYMQEICPERDCRVYQRVYVLNKEQLTKFWRYRGVQSLGEYGAEPIRWGACGSHAGTKDSPEPEDPIWHAVAQGVLYVLDEAPVAFHARRWAQTGIEFSDYITQHRKLSDDVWSLARHSSLLDKQFRDTADFCVILDNWYTKMIKMFTAPKKIKVQTYENCPPGQGEEPTKSEDIYIDPKGYSRCFWTAKGLGIAGVNADVGKTAKGMPLWVAFASVPLIALCVWFGLTRGMHWVNGYGSKKLSISQGNVGKVMAAAVPGLAPLAPDMGKLPFRVLEHTNPPADSQPRQLRDQDFPVCYGHAHTGSLWALDTDQGVIYGTNLLLRGRFVLLDGEKYLRQLKLVRKSS